MTVGRCMTGAPARSSSIHSPLYETRSPVTAADCALSDAWLRGAKVARAVGGDRVAVRARGAAVAARAVAREVEDQAGAAVIGAHREPREVVDADQVDHRHRDLDGDA